MYPIDLQGLDVVLGIEWLQNLGRVLHDWSKLSMEFSVDGICLDTWGRDGKGNSRIRPLYCLARIKWYEILHHAHVGRNHQRARIRGNIGPTRRTRRTVEAVPAGV